MKYLHILSTVDIDNKYNIIAQKRPYVITFDKKILPDNNLLNTISKLRLEIYI